LSKEIKVYQSRNLSDYSKKLVELVKAGNEVLLDQCISMLGKIYTIKYYEAEAVAEETVEEAAVSSEGVTTKAVKKPRGGSASTK
jgi:hypothetical protein